MFSEDLSELFGVTKWPHLFDVRDRVSSTVFVWTLTLIPPIAHPTHFLLISSQLSVMSCYSDHHLTYFTRSDVLETSSKRSCHTLLDCAQLYILKSY